MRTEYDRPVRYFLALGNGEIPMNDLIGRRVRLSYEGIIHCIACGKVTRTSYGQGFCYNCLQTAPEAGESVLQPELSRAHFGIARDMEWAREHDLIDHYVYLALSPGLKVGVTRHHQIPVRWIDQGARAALLLAKTPNRHIAGIIEVWLKQFFSDKTNWREMLTDRTYPTSLLPEGKEKAAALLTPELKKYLTNDQTITSIDYPGSPVTAKIESLSLDRYPVIEGELTGIRGQYLIFDRERVLNVRRHNGYVAGLSWE